MKKINRIVLSVILLFALLVSSAPIQAATTPDIEGTSAVIIDATTVEQRCRHGATSRQHDQGDGSLSGAGSGPGWTHQHGNASTDQYIYLLFFAGRQIFQHSV